ncbi:MAG: hypothetical protein MK041_13840, partial [Aquabacterium sp.]|nr:hypothetical protein [Aquabacterium sp.]
MTLLRKVHHLDPQSYTAHPQRSVIINNKMKYIILTSILFLISSCDNRTNISYTKSIVKTPIMSDLEIQNILQKMYDGKIDETEIGELLSSLSQKINSNKQWGGTITDHPLELNVGDSIDLYIIDEGEKIYDLWMSFSDHSNVQDLEPRYQGGYLNRYKENQHEVMDLYYNSISFRVTYDPKKIESMDEFNY